MPKSLYRQSALEHYAQQREKDILPQFVSPPVFLLLWLLMFLLLAGLLVAWLTQVPVYTVASGIVQSSAAPASSTGQAVIFVPAAQASQVHNGMPVKLTVQSTGQEIDTTVSSVATTVLSPSDAQKQYQLGQNTTDIVPGPSIAVRVNLGTSLSSKTYAGSLLTARLQLGTQRLLSLLPGVGGLIGG
jgi:hypothetical protein